MPDENTLRGARENFEREHIQETLIAYNWDTHPAANSLGIERTNLYRKMKQLAITKENQNVEEQFLYTPQTYFLIVARLIQFISNLSQMDSLLSISYLNEVRNIHFT